MLRITYAITSLLVCHKMSEQAIFTQSLQLLQSLPSELRRTLHLIYDLDKLINERKNNLLNLSEQHILAIQNKTTNNYNKTNDDHNNNNNTLTCNATTTTASHTDNDNKTDTTSTNTTASTDTVQSQSSTNLLSNIVIPPVYTDWVDIETTEARLISESDEIKKLCSKKCQYSLDCYTMIDTYIKRIDNNIRRYELKLRKINSYDITAAPVDRRRMLYSNNLIYSNPEYRELVYVLQNMYINELQRYNSQQSLYNNTTSQNEPVYCICKRVSFGQMLGCDSMDQCVGGEWYHYSCLGIQVKPRGKWYCDACKQKQGKINTNGNSNMTNNNNNNNINSTANSTIDYLPTGTTAAATTAKLLPGTDSDSTESTNSNKKLKKQKIG